VPEIVDITLELVPAVVEFLQSFPGEKRDRDFWRARTSHWWGENPFWSETVPMGWALTDGSGVYGFKGLIPIPYRIQESAMVAFGATVWRIDRRYRGAAGLAFMDKTRDMAHQHLMFNTTPTDGVKKLLNFYGFSDIKPPEQRTVTIVIHAHAGMVRALRSKAWKGLVKVLSFPSQALAGWHRRLKVWDAFKARKPALSVAQAFETHAFDVLWDRTKSRYPVTKQRDARYVKWYCFGNRRYRGKTLLLSEADGELTGFGILMHRRMPAARDLFCVDLWPPDEAVFRNIAAQAILAAAEEGYDTVTIAHPGGRHPEVITELGKWFLACETRSHHYGYLCAPERVKRLIDAGDAFFCVAEGDYGC
jgi:hypothetical protein